MNDPSRPIVDEPVASSPALERRVRELENEVAHHRVLVQREQARRIEAIGALAGGVAHDFNNLLTSVLGNTDLALAHLPPSSPVRAHLKHIEHAARRAAELTKQMLACSGRGQFLVRPVDVTETVRSRMPWMRASCPPQVRLDLALVDELPQVDGDAEQLGQVLLHLVSNACEAIGSRAGTIRVATGTADCTRADLEKVYADEQMAPGRYVWLDVSDTGPGIDADIVSRIFDPFFTTKFVGRGLGLAVVLGILRGHRGAVQVKTELGKGTTMRLLLPMRSTRDAAAGAAPASASAAATPASADVPRGVLVIDDEETVRGVAKMILERAGFRVITAASGDEGIARFGAFASDIGIVLLDLKLPAMNSRQVAEELVRLRPDVRIVLSSGYMEEEALSTFEPGQFAGFLAKPYRFEELIDCMQRVASGETPGAPRD